jgi:hypothetical protein
MQQRFASNSAFLTFSCARAMNNAERDCQKSTTWTLEIPSFVQPKIVSKLCKALALAEQVTSQTISDCILLWGQIF